MTDLLAGIRVLDLSALIPGPYASLLLADMGAEVIKVESRLGDLMRQLPPMQRRRSATFLALNRGKQSLGLDLKREAGRQLFLDLARHADVVLEGFRPGRAERLGVGPDEVHAVNPSLVYCRISGFGQTGPDAARSGHDVTYLARAGVLDLSRRSPADRPVIPPIPVADLAAGTLAATSICAALVRRARSGEGCTLDVGMLDAVASWMGLNVAAHLAGAPARPGQLPLAGRYPFYNVYPTAEGGHVALGALEPVFWHDFCRALGRPDLAADQFRSGADQEAVAAELARIFAAQPAPHWAAFFQEHGLPAEVVGDVDAMLADPQLAARGAYVDVSHAEEGVQRQAALPIKVSPAPAPVDLHAARDDAGGQAGRAGLGDETPPAPDLGADSRAVLRSVLGLDDEAIDGLIAARVVFAVTHGEHRRVGPGYLP